MTTILSIMNPKGGVAKTTTTINLASYLSRTYSVAIIDTDPQASIKTWLGEQSPLKIYHAAHLSQLKALPSNPRALAFDFILIDTPANMKPRHAEIIAEISQLVLVPCKASKLDLEPTLGFIDTCLIPNQIPFKVLLTQAIPTSSYNEEIKNHLLEQRIPLFSTIARHYQAYIHAVANHMSIFDMGYTAGSAQNDYQRIAQEVLEHLKQTSLTPTLSGHTKLN